jgi:hypothetical protein
MIKIDVLKEFEVVDTVVVSGNEILEGSVPAYLSESAKACLECGSSKTLEDYFLVQLGSMGNATSLMQGSGLTLLSQSGENLDSGSLR